MKTDRATLSSEQLALVIRAAESAFPQECCGLLFGQRTAEGWQIVQAHAMRNASAKPELGFEFEAREQLRAYREAEAAGLEIVGHYHSHPNARAGPSPTDLQIARERYDRGLWLIVAIENGKFIDASLWQLHGEPGEFVRVELRQH
ncbi:M67 family metallopeptidase [candidate division KSB1 bacterium]|nr:M67 family metallopeptidase [candidate division KSB1 bacterium]